MFEEASEVFDNMFKSSFPLTFIVFIPAVLILVSPLPAEAAHEFTVYRMQQYDLQGQPYGKDVNRFKILGQAEVQAFVVNTVHTLGHHEPY